MFTLKNKKIIEILLKACFLLSFLLITFLSGYIVSRYSLFPSQIIETNLNVLQLKGVKNPFANKITRPRFNFNNNGNMNFNRNGSMTNPHNVEKTMQKFQQLAKDAQSSGDPVMAENYLQHADHYSRRLSELNEKFKSSDNNKIKDNSEEILVKDVPQTSN